LVSSQRVAPQILALKDGLKAVGVMAEVISKFKGTIKSAEGQAIEVDKTFLTSASGMYDAIYVPGGAASGATLKINGEAIHFINEAFKHCKPIAAVGEGVDVLQSSEIKGVKFSDSKLQDDQGVLTLRSGEASGIVKSFIHAIAQHCHWNRLQKDKVPA
jgi:catalase